MINKNTKLARISIFLTAVNLLAFSAASALAQSNTYGLTARPVRDIINDVIVWFLGFATGLAVLFMIIGGVYYITSAGDQDRMQKAKKIFEYAIIGLFVIGISYSIVKAVAKMIGG